MQLPIRGPKHRLCVTPSLRISFPVSMEAEVEMSVAEAVLTLRDIEAPRQRGRSSHRR
jgi:hypothetical protein